MKLILSLVFFLTACISHAQQPNKKTKNNKLAELPNAVLDSFENEIRREIAAKDYTGAAYLLYHKGKIVRTRAIGESDVNNHRPIETTDIFRLASMTKPITSLALLLLQEDGLINMNDRLETYLPAFAHPVVMDRMDTVNGTTLLQTHPAKHPILLRHLLTHTAGFASQYGGNLGGLYLSTFTDIYNHDLAYFCNQLAALPLNHEPGDGWVYGPSINVAARVIEVVSGVPFPLFLQKRVFEPMGMNETRFFLDSFDADRLTTLHTKDTQGNIKVMDNGSVASSLISGPKVFFSGSGGLTSTLEDYLSFCRMILNNGVHEGKIIAKSETIAMMKTDQVPLNINADLNTQPGQLTEGFTFGYQIVRKENERTIKKRGTIGWSGATGPIFFIDPKEELIGIFMLQMQPHSHIKSRKEFANWMIRAVK